MTAPTTTRGALGAALGAWVRPAVGTVAMLVPLAVAQLVTGLMFCAAPLAASAALAAATPNAPAARPASIAIGHAVCAATGLAVATTFGHGTVAAVVAVLPAVALSTALGRSHAPAIASAALVGASGSWRVAVALVAGGLALAAIHAVGIRLQAGKSASQP
ncbi:HPP family protein [Nocardia stercoris]|uniref:HPP transmembrane region domain-containing protein n=1 Tax=Nocardia stercoris TaxID=2483361 RepID=A0A3M2LF77_9NOCA|nr:HPP family protein [Nocardia stercoris]RMI35470.1 hypothetical protein EBN03_04230 [Nocardia stercoris]